MNDSTVTEVKQIQAEKPLPRRRVVLELNLGADDRDSMIRELEQIVIELRRGFYSDKVISGGCSAGFDLKITEDPTITHDSYFEAIKDLP